MDKHPDKILRKHNVRSTPMRVLILRFLSGRNTAASLTDIENHFDRSERTTLFRSLRLFVESNIAHKIDDGTGVTKYAICAENCHCSIDSDLHIHFHCRVCEQTTCLPNNKIPALHLPKAFHSEEINLVVKGVCAKCTQK